MAELPAEDLRVQNTLKTLFGRLRFISGRGLSSQTMLDLQSEIERTRFNFKAEHGYDFPPIGPLVLPSSNQIIFFRTDMTNKEIQDKILYLLRDFAFAKIPVVTLELVRAMKMLWPDYKVPVETFRKHSKMVLH